MLQKQILTLFAVFSLVYSGAIAQDMSHIDKLIDEKPNNFYEIQKEMNAYFDSFPEGEKKSGLKQYKRWEHFMQSRLMPDGTLPHANDLMNVLDNYRNTVFQDSKRPQLQGYKWSLIGPVEVPEPRDDARSTGIGRLNAVELHPTNPNVLWVAAASGGVWKSVDDGKTWTQKYPNEEFFTLGANDITISKSNPNIMYIATGDSYGSNSSGYDTYSIGVLKSVNGGDTWFTTGLSKTINEAFRTTRILAHPENPDHVIVGTSSGVYKTTDGGEKWNRIGQARNIYDFEMHAGDPNIVYASCLDYSGVFKTTDFGDSWTEVLNISGSRRVELAVYEGEEEEFHGVVAAIGASYDNGFNALYMSMDSGEEWDKMSDRASTGNILGWDHTGEPANKSTQGQGWYDLALAIDPTDFAHIVVGGINMWESYNAGADFECTTHFRGYFSLDYVHADFHDMNFTADGTLYLTNDGGIYKTDFDTFEDLSDGLPITQYYWFGSSVQDPSWLVCGAQDNGTVVKKGDKWQMGVEGDGGACLINPENQDIIYGSYVWGDMRRSTNGGETFKSMILSWASEVEGANSAWISPMCVDPISPNRIFVGFNDIWKSEDYGAGNWRRVSDFKSADYNDIQQLRVYGSTIYASNYTQLVVSHDNGFTWEKVTPTSSSAMITDITIDQNDPTRCWFTTGGFTDGHKVFEYSDGEVKNISGNLLNVPVHSIVWQPDSPDRLYIGTEIGVYYTDYNTGYWERYGTDLPNVIVSRLEVLPKHDLLRISTYGKGLWEAPLMDCNLPQPEIEVLGETEFCEGESVTLRAKDDYINFVWSTGEKTREISVTESGLYTLSVIEGNCSAKSIPVEINVLEIPDLEITGKYESAFCEGQNDEITLRASSGFASYEWSTGSTEKEIDVTETGTYSVTAVTSTGCETSTSFEVIDQPLPESPRINQQSSLLICVQPEAVAWQWYEQREDETWRKLLGKDEQKLQLDTLEDIGQIFKVEISDKYGCLAESEPYHVTTGISELNADESVSINPNPVENIVSIEMDIKLKGTLQISIIDMNGRILYDTAEFSNGNLEIRTIDMSNYASGAYILNIKSGDRQFSDLIIKK
jgi:photosystem II stability/assembly factor-like uncharacterized protein